MSLIENYFGKKSIEEITYDDVLHFFSIERKESDRIEFKSYNSKEPKEEKHFNNILESIVAFLNSDGGLLIWGSPEGTIKSNSKEKCFIGEPVTVPHKYEDDQLISKITDKINPNPNRIRKKIIEINGRYIYLFEIEKSEYSPHQVNNIFYMRIDGATKPAPYHYIDALFKKIKYPDIKGYIKIENFYPFQEPLNPQSLYHLRISPIISNRSKFQNDYNIYYSILCDLGEFSNWINHSNHNNSIRYDANGMRITNLKGKEVLYYGEIFSESWTIIINPHDLAVKKNEINIIFSFGTKLSPMKISTYKLSLNINIRTDFNKTFFIEMKENVLLSDHIESKGLSEDESINIILGRA